jgi:hypothetical protein
MDVNNCNTLGKSFKTNELIRSSGLELITMVNLSQGEVKLIAGVQ